MMKWNYLPLFFLAFAPKACAQTPDTPSPEQWGDRYVAALQSGDRKAQEDIITQIFTPEALANPGADRLIVQLQRLQQMLLPLEYHHSEVIKSESASGSARRALHIYLRKKDAVMWQDIQMFLDPAPPHKIQQIIFIAEVAEPVSLPNGDITQKNTLDWLDAYLTKLVAENDLYGSALIARGDQILFERYFGYADAAKTRPIDAQTLFNLGSGNKMFTALAIARLQEQGKLTYEDRLTHWLPDFPDPERASKVTIRQLLSHTSGIAEFWRPDTEAEMRQCSSWRQMLGIVYRVGFAAEPGTEAGYSNSNFLVLGAIVEKAGGRDYFDFIADLIYTPAGMAQSGTYYYDERSARPLAMPLARDEQGGWREAPHGKRGSPAGGGYSNGRDMLRFAAALKQNRFVTAATLREMVSDQIGGLKDAFPYGLGFIPQKNSGMVSYGHGGIAPGVNFEFRYFPSEDVTLVVFCNQNNGAYDDLKKNMIKLITGDR